MSDKEKKNKKEAFCCLTTPVYVYIAVFALAVLFLFVSVIIDCCKCDNCCCGWWSTLFLNVGYGTIASLFVALLIDIGNTKRQKSNDKQKFDRLNADLKELCSDFPSEMYIAVYDAFGYDEKGKRTFEQWTRKLFLSDAEDSTRQKAQIDYILQWMKDIRKCAIQLKTDAKHQYDNSYVTPEFEDKIERIISKCSKLLRNTGEANYEFCVRTITNDFKSAVVDLYSELGNDYSRCYNENDYTEQT